MTKKARIILVSVLFTVLLIAGGLLYLLRAYEVKTVYVEGNVHYTNDEIKDMVMSGRLGHNSFYLSVFYKNKKVEDVPFVQTYDVTIIDKNTIRIHVYEKALAGYVEYLNHYFYFDKDGMVVESSKVKTLGIPLVTGLELSYIVLDDYLPIEDKAIFQTILNLTQTLEKYSLSADRLHFDQTGAVTISFANVRVKMGNLSTLDEKCSDLQEILPYLEGKSGVLNMENTSPITFRSDEENAPEEILEPMENSGETE